MPVRFLFLFYFRGRRCLILLHGVSFTYEIPNEIILLCIDYDIALRLEKNWKLEEVSDFTVKFREFCFSSTSFETKLRKKYSEFAWLPGLIINVIQPFSFQLYEIFFDYLFKVAKVTSKQYYGGMSISLWSYLKLLICYSLNISFVY